MPLVVAPKDFVYNPIFQRCRRYVYVSCISGVVERWPEVELKYRIVTDNLLHLVYRQAVASRVTPLVRWEMHSTQLYN